MSPKKRSAYVPDNINEEYYQINPEILNSFSKYRPPVDLFNFREDIAVLAPFSRKGARLTNEQVEEAAQLCADGLLFVSRSDHHIYSQHIVKQLDLVLQDNNLKESEMSIFASRRCRIATRIFTNSQSRLSLTHCSRISWLSRNISWETPRE